jgi:hypothetical protein
MTFLQGFDSLRVSGCMVLLHKSGKIERERIGFVPTVWTKDFARKTLTISAC